MIVSRTKRISGLALRYALVTVLVDHDRDMTVGELGRAVAASGFEIGGRPGKTVSDALRWEVRRDRVVRAGRGRYRWGRAPRTSLHRMRRHLAARRAAIRAAPPFTDQTRWLDTA